MMGTPLPPWRAPSAPTSVCGLPIGGSAGPACLLLVGHPGPCCVRPGLMPLAAARRSLWPGEVRVDRAAFYAFGLGLREFAAASMRFPPGLRLVLREYDADRFDYTGRSALARVAHVETLSARADLVCLEAM